MKKFLAQLVVLAGAAAGGFWLSRRLAAPTVSNVPVDTVSGGVRLVATPAGEETA
jgi:hypothetical protein